MLVYILWRKVPAARVHANRAHRELSRHSQGPRRWQAVRSVARASGPLPQGPIQMSARAALLERGLMQSRPIHPTRVRHAELDTIPQM